MLLSTHSFAIKMAVRHIMNHVSLVLLTEWCTHFIAAWLWFVSRIVNDISHFIGIFVNGIKYSIDRV